MMDDRSVTSSRTDIPVEERLAQLNNAEAKMMEVLEIVANTCGELEELPFSDEKKLQNMSNNLISALQDVRSTMVSNIGAVKPPVQSSSNMKQADDVVNRENIEKLLASIEDKTPK